MRKLPLPAARSGGMTRLGDILHGLTAAVFVIAGAIYAAADWMSPRAVMDGSQMTGPFLPDMIDAEPIAASAISRLYLQPENPLMWSLLIAVWATVALDAIGQWIDPGEPDGRRVLAIRPLLLVALAAASAAPWIFPHAPGGLAALMALAATAAVLAARRGAGRQRPALGFLGGWATAVTSAGLAAVIGTRFSMPMEWVAALSILPATAFGMAAQLWIGQSIGYSAALIWAFCALAVTTMGTDPTIALAAILGIAGMASVLVRAAS